MIFPPFYVPTEAVKVLCVESCRHTSSIIQTEALCRENDFSTFQRSNGSCEGTLREELSPRQKYRSDGSAA